MNKCLFFSYHLSIHWRSVVAEPNERTVYISSAIYGGYFRKTKSIHSFFFASQEFLFAIYVIFPSSSSTSSISFSIQSTFYAAGVVSHWNTEYIESMVTCGKRLEQCVTYARFLSFFFWAVTINSFDSTVLFNYKLNVYLFFFSNSFHIMFCL